MVYSQVTAQLRNRGELLLSGQIDELVASYVFPLPVFLPSNRLILKKPEEAAAILGLMREALVERGVVSRRPQVNAVNLPRSGRLRVWLDWHELAIPAEGTRISSAIDYCRQTEAGIRTEMVNYTRSSLPDFGEQLLTIALSA